MALTVAIKGDASHLDGTLRGVNGKLNNLNQHVGKMSSMMVS